MTALLAALLFSFTPSPDAFIHQCRAFERVMEYGVVDSEWVPVMGTFAQMPCEVWQDEFGHWALASCGDMPFAICGICITAVDAYGSESDCGELVGTVP